MGERKVLNKYYPPDFDPAKLPRGKRQQNNEMKVRMMLPMSVRCKTCGTFMYKGTKFNTRKEDVEGEDYLGIKIFRFYYRCSNCAAEFCMRTDPKTCDYVMEQGASRNYEPWRETDVLAAEAVRAREEEERGNAMKALENRTKDSKREMDIMEALDEMKSLKARHAGITAEDALRALQQAGAAAAAEGDDDDGGGGGGGGGGLGAAAGGGAGLPDEDTAALQQFLQQQHTIMRRLESDDDDDEDDEQQQRANGAAKRRKLSADTQAPQAAAAAGSNGAVAAAAAEAAAGDSQGAAAPRSSKPGAGAAAAAAVKQSAAPAVKPLQPLVRVAVKAKKPPPAAAAAAGAAGDDDGGGGGILGLIGGYGSSSGSGSEDNT